MLADARATPVWLKAPIGLAIAGSPENDGHLLPWQEVIGNEIVPDPQERLREPGNACMLGARTPRLTARLYALGYMQRRPHP